MSLEQHVRAEVMEFVRRRAAFKPLDVADAIEPKIGAVPIPRVSRLVRQLFDEGLLAPFGYRRTLTQERTRHGVITAVLYAPPGSTRGGSGRSSAGSRVSSRTPTKTPSRRGFQYLDLPSRDRRRLDRQTDALRARMSRTAEDLIEVGELLLAVRAVVGAEGLSFYLSRELAMSRDTARRLMRVAEVFRHHPDVSGLAVVRPSALYKLAEVSFPADLREAILEKGLVVDGVRRRLEELTAPELILAKRRFSERADAFRRLRMDPESPERERRLRALEVRPITHVFSEPVSVEDKVSLDELKARARGLAEQKNWAGLEHEDREDALSALRALIDKLEGEGS